MSTINEMIRMPLDKVLGLKSAVRTTETRRERLSAASVKATRLVAESLVKACADFCWS